MDRYTKLMRVTDTVINSAINGFGITAEETTKFNSSDIADMLLDMSRVETDTLFPVKVRADRRKNTVKKHHRLKQIADQYPIKDCNKHNLKKTVKSNKCWYVYDDSRKDITDKVIAEGLADYNYQCRKTDFYKVVDQFLAVKYILKWSEVVETEDFDPLLDGLCDIVDESLEFDNLEDIHLHIAEAFNEEWEPICYEIVKISCGTEELVDQWFPEVY